MHQLLIGEPHELWEADAGAEGQAGSRCSLVETSQWVIKIFSDEGNRDAEPQL